MLLYILIPVALILGVLWFVYNQLVAANENIEEALSGIDVHLKKRFELVPGLVEIVKGYTNHEEELFLKVTKLRSNQNEDIEQKEKQDAGLNLVSRSLQINVENYPNLKSDKHFLELMEELSKVEDELAMSRRYLNGTIRDFNTKISIFPNVIFSRILGFTERPFYEVESFEKEPHRIFE